MATQLELFSQDKTPKSLKKTKDVTSTFISNMSLPIHRWYRYSAGFSGCWVQQIISEHEKKTRKNVFDPFVGSGTTLIEAERCDANGIGLDSHPLISRIAQAKLFWREDPQEFYDYIMAIVDDAQQNEKLEDTYAPLIRRCFPETVLIRLDAIKHSWLRRADGTPLSELAWLTLISIIRECSPVGTAQWQYVLPNKVKARIIDPYSAFMNKAHVMSQDMLHRQNQNYGPPALVLKEDVRGILSVPQDWADIIITSPPYANNYDYADATRLEMTFMGYIQGWGDLQLQVRKDLIYSCTQHVTPLIKKTKDMIKNPLLHPIEDELSDVCEKLSLERETHGGKKAYHTMIAAYFLDMAKVFENLRKIARANSRMCFVIGDSAPYGVYVPVERWLGDLAVSAGFKSYHFDKTRDRNIKWKNRKHQVPLHEGHLWMEG